MYPPQIQMPTAERSLVVVEVKDIDHGKQMRLDCGAIVNVYSNGTVMVQGKLRPNDKAESLAMLRRALPAETRWCIK